MSRRALALAVVLAPSAAAILAACSLTDTSGLSSGATIAPEGGDAPVADASPFDAAPVADASLDGGPDAAKDPTLLGEYSFEDPPGQNARDTSGNGHDG